MTTLQSLACVFPGQGSQSVGMLAELAGSRPLIQEAFVEASQRLPLDLWRLSQEGPEERLNQTENTQPAMLAAGIAVWRAWENEGGPLPAFLAGHSLGEYTALVASGCLSLADGAWLVAERGRLMQEAVPAGEGAMAAILGLDSEAVISLCAEAAQDQVVAAANLNAPGQVVIAGHRQAVGRAMELAKARGARRVVELAVSVPSHCALMKPVAEGLAQCFDQLDWQEPRIPVVQNADVGIHREPQLIRAALIRQLERPVRWIETVQRMRVDGIQSVLECGPGKVLCGLVRRIDGDLATHSLGAEATFNQALAATRA